MENVKQRLSGKDFLMNVLNGAAVGIIVALIPGALFSELVKVLLGSLPWLAPISMALSMSNAMTGLICGTLVGLNFKFNPIQSASLGLACLFGSGAVVVENGAILLKGTGDIINIMLVSAIGAALIIWIGNSLKAYTVLVMSPLMILTAGYLGHLMYPYVTKITALVGMGIASLLDLQPTIMAILLAIAFGFLIVSPLTSVGIGLAISISGLGAGAANIGICATGFAFAILGWRVNSKGISITHFLGSAKISMPVVVKNPKTLLPVLSSSAFCGFVASLLNIQGIPMSAGFGLAGLVGPINHLKLVEGGFSMPNILITTLAFVIVPILSGLFFKWLYINKLHFVSEEDYRLSI